MCLSLFIQPEAFCPFPESIARRCVPYAVRTVSEVLPGPRRKHFIAFRMRFGCCSKLKGTHTKPTPYSALRILRYRVSLRRFHVATHVSRLRSETVDDTPCLCLPRLVWKTDGQSIIPLRNHAFSPSHTICSNIFDAPRISRAQRSPQELPQARERQSGAGSAHLQLLPHLRGKARVSQATLACTEISTRGTGGVKLGVRVGAGADPVIFLVTVPRLGSRELCILV